MEYSSETQSGKNGWARLIGNSTGRRQEFCMKTLLVHEEGKKAVYKQAASGSAKAFLSTVIERERKAAHYLHDVYDVLMGQLKNDSIKYEFLPYPSIAQLIGDELNVEHCERAHEIFETYISNFGRLETKMMEPIEFLQQFGRNDRSERRQYLCFTCGVLDLMPRNILVAKDKWMVLDNEWTFEFPVPVHFVIFRAIRELAMALQGPIRKCTNQDNPATAVFASGFNSYYVPDAWLKHLQGGPKLNVMLCWELGFQKYVTGQFFPVGRIKLIKRKKDVFLWKEFTFAEKIKELLVRVPGLKRGLKAAERTLVYLRF